MALGTISIIIILVLAGLILVLAGLILAKRLMKTKRVAANGKAVVVTGCSTGIGRGIALHLARKGFVVFATVRRPQDAESLSGEGLSNLVPVCPLDLTSRENIASAAQFIEGELARRMIEGLWAIVNNAGGGWICPLEAIDGDRFRREFDTRIFGPLGLVTALLPAIRRGHGRLAWVVVAGMTPLPYIGSIHIPEWATQCLAATLDIELHPWRIPSIRIGCGMIQSAGPEKSYADLDQMLSGWSPVATELYGSKMQEVKGSLRGMDDDRTPAVEVGKVAFDALTARTPKSFYRVGKLSTVLHMMEFIPGDWIKAIMIKKWRL